MLTQSAVYVEITMQPQQQQTVVVPTQPTYVHPPYTTSSVVNTYRSGQSAAIGILLIIAGALSIVFNIVDLHVGNDDVAVYYMFYDHSLSWYSNGVARHGLWCGIMVSITLFHYRTVRVTRWCSV